jgi:hypothetical protein
MAQDTYLPAVQVAERYSVCLKTLDRWLADQKLKFPTPLVINRRRSWKISALESWERSLVPGRHNGGQMNAASK